MNTSVESYTRLFLNRIEGSILFCLVQKCNNHTVLMVKKVYKGLEKGGNTQRDKTEKSAFLVDMQHLLLLLLSFQSMYGALFRKIPKTHHFFFCVMELYDSQQNPRMVRDTTDRRAPKMMAGSKG